MLPVLLKLGPITITSLGVFIVLGLFSGSFLVWKKSKEENFNEENIMDLLILTSIFSFISSRTFYFLLNWEGVGKSFINWFNFVSKPGLSWFGAILGGIATIAIYCRKNKWDFFKIVDLFIFGAVLMSCLVLIGTFLDGSYYGTTTQLVWGIKFPGLDTPRHPIQIYELILLFGVYQGLYYFDKNYRTYNWYRDKRGEAKPGFLFLYGLTLISVIKLLLAFLKERDLYWKNNLILLVITIIFGLIFMFIRSGLRDKLTFLSNLNKSNFSFNIFNIWESERKKNNQKRPKLRKGQDLK